MTNNTPAGYPGGYAPQMPYQFPAPPRPVKSRKGTIITLSILLGLTTAYSAVASFAYTGQSMYLEDCQDASYYWEEAVYADSESEQDDNIEWAEQADAECFY